jgi:Transposase IS116/IS110/IS902 family
MTVIIGIDPHKASHTAVGIGCDGQQLPEINVRATCQQTAKLLAWAEPLGPRTWAVESAGGLGYLLSQQLVGAGERVLASYAGVAPIERSSGGRIVHRLSRRGNRQLNHAIHMVAICQIRQTDSEGRAYFERKVAEGKTKREAICSLKRQVSNAVYRQLILDAQK